MASLCQQLSNARLIFKTTSENQYRATLPRKIKHNIIKGSTRNARKY